MSNESKKTFEITTKNVVSLFGVLITLMSLAFFVGVNSSKLDQHISSGYHKGVEEHFVRNKELELSLKVLNQSIINNTTLLKELRDELKEINTKP